MNVSVHRLLCTGCGVRIDGAQAQSNFRCVECGDLFEVEYAWSAGAPGSEKPTYRPNPGALKHLWQERRSSTMAVDQSGVWRFRELLPIVSEDRVVTLREGNTPVYEMPRAASALGLNWLLAKHQGMNPTGSFKDTGMTAALSVAVSRGFHVGGVRVDGEHECGDGGVCGARGVAQPGADS